MKHAYIAFDRIGKQTSGAIEADDPGQARELLRQQGLFVSSVEKGSGTAKRRRAARSSDRRQGGLKHLKHVAMWAREMLVLVRCGTPLASAMAAIERQQPEGPWRTSLERLRGLVEEGVPLSEAMGAARGLFDPVSRSLIAAGESSGNLDEVLMRVAEIAKSRLVMRQTLAGALVYPCLLVMIGAVVTVVMLIGVVPRFAELFNSLGSPLPPTTKFMLMLSDHVRAAWWAWLIGLGVAATAVRWLFVQPSGRRLLDHMLVRLPVAGRVTRSIATAKITRVLGVLMQSHVPMLQALELARDAAGNEEYGQLMDQVRDAAGSGERISTILGRSPLITPSVAEAIRHGEENGQVGPILTDITEFLDEENQVIIKSAMSLIEPAILVVLGLLVGGMALSLFIPMFDMAAMAGGGG